ncbi:hypothetical protein BH09SUM1_BH09SUM1_01810 [soil metagenome]
MPRSRLHEIEMEVERKALKYKRELMEKALADFAAEEAAKLFPPEGKTLPPDTDAPRDAHDDGGGRDG